MSYVRTGSCNQCGECCKLLANPLMVSKTTGLCRFLEKESSSTYKCKIREWVNKYGLNRPVGVTDKQFEYWKVECQPYPDPEDESHIPPRHHLPDGCTFRLVRKDG